MKYTVYASAIKRIAKIMYNENEMNDYEDELTSIEAVEE